MVIHADSRFGQQGGIIITMSYLSLEFKASGQVDFVQLILGCRQSVAWADKSPSFLTQIWAKDMTCLRNVFIEEALGACAWLMKVDFYLSNGSHLSSQGPLSTSGANNETRTFHLKPTCNPPAVDFFA